MSPSESSEVSTPLACAACRYELTGLSDGNVVQCPECGHVGLPYSEESSGWSVGRVVLTGLTVAFSAWLFVMGALLAAFSFRIDWSLGEAKKALAVGVLLCVLTLATLFLVFFTPSGKGRIPRMIAAGMHGVMVVACIAMAAGWLRRASFVSALSPVEIFVLVVYGGISAATLIHRRDLRAGWRRDRDV